MSLNNFFKPNKVLVCTGFHRSASSATARYLHNTGLSMGMHFVGGGISNYGGHYEDWSVVNLHDRLLKESLTNWQFHDEVSLPSQQLDPFLKYIQLRDQQISSWGFKDPRSVLFLNEWDKALAGRGQYLFLIRHWSSSIESLLRRHSRRLAHDLIVPDKGGEDFKFWLSPNLAAKMWLAYNQRLLDFVAKNPEQCLVVTQRALFNDIPLIETLNTRFGFQFESTSKNHFNSDQLHDYSNNNVNDVFAEGMKDQLDSIWSKLLDKAFFKTDDESPHFIAGKLPKKHFIQVLDSFKIEATEVQTPDQTNTKKDTDIVLRLLQNIGHVKTNDGVTELLHESRVRDRGADKKDVERLLALITERYKTSTHVNLAFAHWLQSNAKYSDAIEYFQFTQQLGVEIPSIYLNLGQCFESLGEIESANKAFKKALTLNPKNPRFLTIYGVFLRNIGKNIVALKYFKQGAELAETNPDCVLPYCVALEQSDQIEKAYKIILNLSNIHPNHSLVRNMLIRLSLKNDPIKGKQLYENIVKEQLSNKEHRYQWLVKACDDISLETVQADFISRTSQHWQEVDLN